MEAAVFMVIAALPVEEFSTLASITDFISRVSTMVFIVPEVFCGSSTQDSTIGDLIRHFICGNFTRGFLTMSFTRDYVVFIQDSVTAGFTTVFITEGSPAGFIIDFTANPLSS
jgi:hypothetical protein